MKKLTVLSIIAASLLLTACGDSATGAEAKAAQETPATATADSAKKCASGKCGGDKATETPATAAAEAKKAAGVAVEKAKEAVAEKATEVQEKATAAVDSVKAKATAAVAAATGAVTAAVASGPDGKALYAKCAGCHGADGGTKPMGKDSVIKGQSEADLVTKMQGYKAGTLNAHGMGALMTGQVSGFSDEDMKAIAAFIAGK